MKVYKISWYIPYYTLIIITCFVFFTFVRHLDWYYTKGSLVPSRTTRRPNDHDDGHDDDRVCAPRRATRLCRSPGDGRRAPPHRAPNTWRDCPSTGELLHCYYMPCFLIWQSVENIASFSHAALLFSPSRIMPSGQGPRCGIAHTAAKTSRHLENPIYRKNSAD